MAIWLESPEKWASCDVTLTSMQFPDLIQIDCEMFSDKLFLLFETHFECRKALASGETQVFW